MEKNKITFEIDNCTKCNHHKVLPDPDPYDWFNYDDVKVLCEKKEKYITVACRPYRTEKECDIPDWCPLLEKNKENEM